MKYVEMSMKNFYIRSKPGCADYLTILGETDGGFMVRIYRDLDGYEKVIDEFMNATLFESCLRTGFLVERHRLKKREPVSYRSPAFFIASSIRQSE